MPTPAALQIQTYPPQPDMPTNPNRHRVFDVLGASYSKLTKRGAPSILCITYHCDARTINEVVCIEHKGIPQRLSIEWWKQRTNVAFPRSVNEALKQTASLQVPVKLRVIANTLNRNYPVIVKYIWRTIN